MTAPRRNIIRPATRPVAPPPQQTKFRKQLEHEQGVLKRWMARLRRAFHAVEKSQERIRRLERRLAQTEETS